VVDGVTPFAVASGAAKEQEGPFVPVPTDVAKRHEPCSICMEHFKEKWHKETGQAVWMNVVKVGDKYYHLTCYNDVNKGADTGGASRRSGVGRSGDSARNTPEPLLGKRKFDAA
jgi:pre-mRNA cleavage complex 2 protein Pcf11